MSEVSIPEAWRQPFPESEIPFILAGILRCMVGETKQNPSEHENRITFRLWKKVRRDAVLRTRPIHPDWEAWELGDESSAEKAGRLDLRFLYSTGAQHPWPCFAIEAKRLHVTFPQAGWKSLVSEYVTTGRDRPPDEEQGMMCFVTGRYSRGLQAGAMLGYVFDGAIEDAGNAIGAAINKHAKKLRLLPGGGLGPSTIVPGEKRIRESSHELLGEIDLGDLFRGRFTIYHLLVAV
jgi:hypothetical protein